MHAKDNKNRNQSPKLNTKVMCYASNNLMFFLFRKGQEKQRGKKG